MASGTYNFPSSAIDVSYIDVRITWSSTYDPATNTSDVSASLQARTTAGVNSVGTPHFKITINGSTTSDNSGTTTIPANGSWTTVVSRTQRDIPHSSTTGALSISISGGTSSGYTDPLVGSGWNRLDTKSTTATLDNAQLYPVLPVYTVERSGVNLTANTSTVSFTLSPSDSITTSSGFITGGAATITKLFAKSATATSDTGLSYASFTTSISASPLERVWVKVTSTADGVYETNLAVSTSNIASTVYGYPSPPTSILATKSGRKVIVTYGNSATNGGYATSPTYTIQRSYNNGISWESHNNDDLLTPATTYIFRVYATNDTGSSLYTQSSSVFISAYGSRFTSSSTTTPISSAKVFIGIGESGADENGWKTVSNVKKWNGSSWADLET